MNTNIPYLSLVYSQLSAFAGLDSFWQAFDTVYGTQYDFAMAETIRAQWTSQDFRALPTIEVVSAEVLGTASGGYAASNNTIYLSESFLATAPEEQIVAVILEEIGHYVDAQVNVSDTAGDEGELFSRIIRGVDLSPIDLNRIQTENDHTNFLIDGEKVTVEQAVAGDPTIAGKDVSFDENNKPYRSFNGGTVKAWIVYKPFTGTLFNNGVNYLDVDQGILGNCYLLAALAEIAQHSPDSINNIIRTISNSNNYSATISGINLEISNNLPAYENPGYTNNGNPVFANYKFSDATRSWEEGWVALIEKAYAIANSQKDLKGPGTYSPGVNSYSTIESGDPRRAVIDFLGGTEGKLEFDTGNLFVAGQFVRKLTDAEINSEIHNLLSNNTRPTFLVTIGDTKKDKNVAGTTGLAGNHAYK